MELLLDPETTIALIAEPKVQEEVAPEVTEEAKTDEAEKKEEKKTE